jgi:hypothetical protein
MNRKPYVPLVDRYIEIIGVQHNHCEFRESFKESMMTSLVRLFIARRFYVRLISLSLGFLIALTSVAIAALQPGYTGRGTSNIPFESLSFQPLADADGLKRAIAFGDPDRGAHGFYLRLPPENGCGFRCASCLAI